MIFHGMTLDQRALQEYATDDDPFVQLREALRAPDRRSRWPRLVAGRGRVLAGAAVAVGAALAAVLLSARPAGHDEPAPPPTPEPRPIVSLPPPAATAAQAPPAPERLWPADPIEVEGNEVRVGERRWRVGNEGDVVVVGDWDCDGRATPAVLRPASGRLSVFDEWADVGGELTARDVGVTEGATHLAPRGCGRAVLRTSTGDVVVDTGPER
jgi:hypothetical protein